jgi:hypothetical protein
MLPTGSIRGSDNMKDEREDQLVEDAVQWARLGWDLADLMEE